MSAMKTLGWLILAVLLFAGCAAAAKPIPGSTVTASGPTMTLRITVTPTRVIATHTVTVTRTYTPQPRNQFSDGQYLIGREVPPGTYHTGGGDCYYAILRDLGGTVDSIVTNDNITGPTTIELSASEKAVEVSGGCVWARI